MRGWAPFFAGILTGVVICVWLFAALTPACADDTQAIADRVTTVLIEGGFDRVETVEIPTVETFEHRNGNAGETFAQVLRVSTHEPEGCRVRIIGHELCHRILAKAYGARDDAEGVCRAVETIIDPVWKPNCESKE